MASQSKDPHHVPDPNWWKDPNLTTWEDKLNAGIRNHETVSSYNQLAELSAVRQYGSMNDGINQATLTSLKRGETVRPRQHVLIFLTNELGGTLKWWRNTARTASHSLPWEVPAEMDSPFLTLRSRRGLSEIVRTVHEQSAQAFVNGHSKGQRDLLKALKRAGWDTDEMVEHVQNLDLNVVARINTDNPNSYLSEDPLGIEETVEVS